MRIFVISVATVAAFCTPIALIVWTYTQSTASALYLIFVPPTLFALALWRIIKIGQSSADNFSRFYSLGFAAYIFVQSFIHIGMNMGVAPITGITLPFVSYGGSSLVILLIGVGILQNVKINARREVE